MDEDEYDDSNQVTELLGKIARLEARNTQLVALHKSVTNQGTSHRLWSPLKSRVAVSGGTVFRCIALAIWSEDG